MRLSDCIRQGACLADSLAWYKLLRAAGTAAQAAGVMALLAPADAVQDSSKEIVAPEQAVQAETVGAPKGLFDLVKQYLRQPDDDIPATINTPLNVVQVSTQGVKFKNAHKNFFPLWAQGFKRNGRPYTQEEVVNAIMDST